MKSQTPPPAFRKLRGYAFDPSLSVALSTKQVNNLTYKVPWEPLEPNPDGSGASIPVGDYVEIVDCDPASELFYEPVDLDDRYLLAQDGLPPSVSNPQFHQQMVYAVVMTTIKNFERALGRKIQWAEHIGSITKKSASGTREEVKFGFVQRMRIYPHALRQANAFYDPNKKALLFGYFRAAPIDPKLQLPGSTVFTCLSHDIIAHETAHAILDGLHRRYIDASNPDTRAFHEAFADIVALFQHFSFPEVLKHQIAKTQGDLTQENLLGQLAQQFGQAIGGYGGLRDAIGEFDGDGNWVLKKPDPKEYATKMEFHARGGILVSAIFDAFLNIYASRTSRLKRIATGGSGILPDGALHPDLVDELAKAAAKSASDILRICIRALDYCPPMDITFGDYLRAIITADFDMITEDTNGYRVAFVEAFQKRGISAACIKSMAVEDLLHTNYAKGLGNDENNKGIKKFMETLVEYLRDFKETIGYEKDRGAIHLKTKKFISGSKAVKGKAAVKGFHRLIEQNLVNSEAGDLISDITGLLFPGGKKITEKNGLEFAYLTTKTASYAISNVWLASRATPNGDIVNHVIVTIAQKRGVRFRKINGEVYVDENNFFVPDHTAQEDRRDHIIFRGGCTLIFDLDAMELRYSVKKDIDDRERMVRQYKYQNNLMGGGNNTYFDDQTMNAIAGPFACMHSHNPNEEGSHAS